jgi:hypothetical protein
MSNSPFVAARPFGKEDSDRFFDIAPEQQTEQKSLAWKCVACGHTKRFTRPASPEVAAPFPKCGGETFDLV